MDGGGWSVGCRRVKTVASAPHGGEIDRVGRVLFDGFAQPVDMDLQGAGVGDVFGIPHLLHQKRAGKHAPRVLDKDLEKVGLFGGEVVLLPSAGHGALLYVQYNITGPKEPAGVEGEEPFNPVVEFAGCRVSSEDDGSAGFLALDVGGEEEEEGNRIAVLPHCLVKAEGIKAEIVPVDNDQIGRVFPEPEEGISPGVDGGVGVLFLCQQRAAEMFAFPLDQQDMVFHNSHPDTSRCGRAHVVQVEEWPAGTARIIP